MICKGHARTNGSQLAAYLADYLTAEKNEMVEFLEIRGSQFPDLHRSLSSWEAEAQRGRTKKALWHAQICPTNGETLTREQQIEAINILERRLNLTGQPRAAVVHRNGEREHIHVVWSRIDRATGKAKTDKASHRRNCDAAREMEVRFGLYAIPTPQFKNDKELKDKYNRRERRQQSKAAPSRHEFQKAKRTGIDPRERKRIITECWLTSDCGKAFRLALKDVDYILAHGDRREFVVVDKAGDIHSLAKQIDGGRVRDVRTRLADIDPASIPKARHVQRDKRAGFREREAEARPLRTTPPHPTLVPVLEAGASSQTEEPTKNPLDPANILADLTERNSTFTASDLRREIEKRTEASRYPANPEHLLRSVRTLRDFVTLDKDRADRLRYTSREMLETELSMRDTSDKLAQQAQHGIPENIKAAAPRVNTLSPEQKAAFEHVTGQSGISLIVGYAGTGKSHMLGAAREAWEAQGYRVRGAALSSMAASSLQDGSGIQSRTLMSTLWRIQNVQQDVHRLNGLTEAIDKTVANSERAKLRRARLQAERDRVAASVDSAKLTSRDIVVLDEAAMVGSRQMNTLLTEAQKAGAKVVLVGDAEQLQAIDAGGCFRALADRHGAVEITGIRRQKEDWQKQATKDFAQSFTEDALGAYRDNGHVHQTRTHDDARTEMVEAWKRARIEQPDKTRIMMAFTRHDVHELNIAARAVYRAEGKVAAMEVEIPTEQGKRSFADGDRLYFLKNDMRLGVMNGSLGTIESISQNALDRKLFSLNVKLDDGKRVTFSTGDYNHFSHGYAATVHKAQGATVDQSFLLASKFMDRHSAYVGMSRHRETVDVYYATDEFRGYDGLVTNLSRDRRKDTTLDYLERAEKDGQPSRFWDRVKAVISPTEDYAKATRIREKQSKLTALLRSTGITKTAEQIQTRRLANILKAHPEKKRERGLSPGI